MRHKSPATLLIPVLASLLGGCLGKSSPSQFYLLEPLAFAAAPVPAGGTPLVALAPVHVPEYVDRPQIVRAVGGNAYRLDELNRWAEPLEDNVARVLIQDLSLLVPAEIVLASASARAREARLRLSLDVLEFNTDAQGQARASGRWQLTRADGTVLSRQWKCLEPASTSDYGLMVRGLNRCIDGLAQDMAAALRQEGKDR